MDEQEFLREFDEVTIGYPVTEDGHLQSLYSGNPWRGRPPAVGLLRGGSWGLGADARVCSRRRQGAVSRSGSARGLGAGPVGRRLPEQQWLSQQPQVLAAGLGAQRGVRLRAAAPPGARPGGRPRCLEPGERPGQGLPGRGPASLEGNLGGQLPTQWEEGGPRDLSPGSHSAGACVTAAWTHRPVGAPTQHPTESAGPGPLRPGSCLAATGQPKPLADPDLPQRSRPSPSWERGLRATPSSGPSRGT